MCVSDQPEEANASPFLEKLQQHIKFHGVALDWDRSVLKYDPLFYDDWLKLVIDAVCYVLNVSPEVHELET